MTDCINGHTCTSTFASMFLSLVALGKMQIQHWYVLHSLTAKTGYLSPSGAMLIALYI